MDSAMKRNRRRAILAVASVAAAFGVGLVVQSVAASRAAPPAPPPAPAVLTVDAPRPVPVSAPAGSEDLPADPDSRTFAGLTGAGFRPLVVPDHTDSPAPGLVPDVGPLGLSCELSLTATAAAGGTAFLRVSAPCRAGEVVSLTHGALRGDYRLSPSGEVMARFPAFSDPADYAVLTQDGSAARTAVPVPGASGFDRMISMWAGADRLSIHAYEFGADFGDEGHVWRDAPSAGAVADTGRGGFLLEIGDPDLPDAARAEVYSFPAAESARTGAVRIELEAEITEATCGRDLRARTLQIGTDLPGAPVDIALSMPGCDQTGGFLQLKNLAQDLMIASQ